MKLVAQRGSRCGWKDTAIISPLEPVANAEARIEKTGVSGLGGCGSLPRLGRLREVSDFAWLGHEFFARDGSRILRGRVSSFS